MNYYNEFDPRAAAWLRELIKAGEIPNGFVDERSITEIKPDELIKYTQCHFFAGIGGWALALRLAGWNEDMPVWTGSCPCQPFSVAGFGLGTADERHLWPTWFDLIRQCRPETIFGEQVASKSALGWLDGVYADMEGENYAIAAFDLCAAGISAPHIRQRLYWVGHTHDERPQGRIERRDGSDELPARSPSLVDRMVQSDSSGWNTRQQACETTGYRSTIIPTSSTGFWSRYDICHFTGSDTGKTRRIEPGSQCLVNGVSNRVALLRGYGNAIVPQIAAVFISSFLDSDREART